MVLNLVKKRDMEKGFSDRKEGSKICGESCYKRDSELNKNNSFANIIIMMKSGKGKGRLKPSTSKSKKSPIPVPLYGLCYVVFSSI